MSARGRARFGLAFLAVLAAGFAWGFLAQRWKFFPHPLLRGIAKKGGAASPAFPAIASLPYVNGQFDPHPAADGVVVNRGGRAAPGYNFFSVPGRKTAFLMDMQGKILWRWNLSSYRYVPTPGPRDDVGYTHLYPNGDVLAFVEFRALLKLDRSSRILWKYDGPVHHDAWVCPDGTIYTILQRRSFDLAIVPDRAILADSILILSPEGREREEIPLLDALENSPYAFLLPKPDRSKALQEPALEVLHTNRVEVFDGSGERFSPLFRKGNILVAFRDINSIAILDGRNHRVLWLWGPTNLSLPHHPAALANGNILLFNNWNTGLRHSAVLEVDPRTNAVVWRYDPPGDFFSPIRGSCQRLSNGDTLIGVSQAGYAIEVAPSGEVVWKFINPDIGADHFRQAIFRIARYEPQSVPFLSTTSP